MLIKIKDISNTHGYCKEVDLPLSKSESNRALMIMHYYELQSHRNAGFQHLSDSDDTLLLKRLLNKIKSVQNQLLIDHSTLPEIIELDCGNAGTVFRFLMTAVSNLQFTIEEENLQTLKILLTGSERMKSRPIAPLVDVLRSLGVSIKYVEKETYPPILMTTSNNKPRLFRLNRVEVNAEQSSQFASSLLLAAPLWNNDLNLHLIGNISSLPYIDMTINMMKKCGVDVERNGRDITVKHGIYNIDNISIEPDWSAAAFWYEIAAFSDNPNILLKKLNVNSSQADAAVIKIFNLLGVETISDNKGVFLKKAVQLQNIKTVNKDFDIVYHDNQQKTFDSQHLTFNFKYCPDLFPAVIATCAGLKIDATFTGLKNLSIKESDRKMAMINELKKINISFDIISDEVLKMHCPESLPYFTEENPIIFNNYGDHRIAMSLSLLSMKIGTVMMENTEVVSKSYPNFLYSVTQ